MNRVCHPTTAITKTLNDLWIGSKTQLHSRVKGTPFLTFPSSLPPDTILDCILDSSWQQNGLLHVVDILRWRGSDFMDCETEFR